MDDVFYADEGERVTFCSSTAVELILWCQTCEERKTLSTDESAGGHSWKAANAIADEFDKYHDEECGS